MRTRLAALAALVIIPVAGCSATQPHHQVASSLAPARALVATNARPLCTGDVVTVVADAPVPCDVRPPQRLDVTGVTIDACDDMGGEPISATLDGPITCEGVDY